MARGKLALLSSYSSSRIPADDQLYELLSNCLLCGACAENCAGGVEADDLIRQGRSLLLEKTGAAFWKKFLAREILPFPDRLKTLRQGQRLVFKKIPRERGLRLRFSSDPRTWPALARPFFLDQPKVPFLPSSGPFLKLGFFVGCMTNYVYPEAGEAALKLMHPLGTVDLPKDQTCCGLPAFSLGDISTAQDLARKNVLAFSKSPLDAIVVHCLSCASHIKGAYRTLLADDPAIQLQVQRFVQKVEELSQFLTSKGIPSRPAATPPPRIVTFHDPCHARRKLKIIEEPRKLLRSLPGLTLVELKGNRCCGHGGLFNLSHPTLSQKILDHPLTELDRTGAEVITTSCMACLMQFKLGIERTGRNVRVRHWTELMV